MKRILIPAVCLLFIPAAHAGDWKSLFDGKSLAGWTKVGGEATYEIADGAIVGHTGPGKNTFLTSGPYADFVLEFDVKCDPGLNSGVQIRSHQYPEDTPQESQPQRTREKGEVYGYQCEIRADINGDHGCAGNFWDEGRRTRWMDETIDAKEKQAAYRAGDWNHFVIVARGDRIRSFINDVPIADFTDDRDASGFIGLQVHAIGKNKGPFQVAWKNIRIMELAENDSVDLPPVPSPNRLTAREQELGWKLLFNGTTTEGWRNYRQDKVSDGWEVVEGAITRVGPAGDIMTIDKFDAFELQLEFRISPEGNSGVMYHVTEANDTPWKSGPEIQIQDNVDGHDPQKCGWLYQLYSSDVDATRPAGEWNHLRVVISPEGCAHFMNGVKYCEYVKGSDDWKEKVAASKFSKFKGFGEATTGYLCLQDHGNPVAYRSIKIRPLNR